MSDAPLWTPSPALAANCNMTRFTHYVNESFGLALQDYHQLYRWSVEQSADFWAALWNYNQCVGDLGCQPYLVGAEEMFGAKWFPNAQINYGENLLKRRDDTAALIFRGEDKVKVEISYNQLYDQVSRVMQALRDAGVGAGDRVAGYLPNMPEATIAMIATTSLGAIWSSCSPDFGTQGVVDRFGQVNPKVLFVVDGYHYNGKSFDVRTKAKDIVDSLDSVEKIVVVQYLSLGPHSTSLDERTLVWDDFLRDYSPTDIQFERFPFDHPLFILFSSGTTGKPKCIVHGAGGTLLTHIREHVLHGDLSSGERVFGFTTTGWMMWNWMISALASGISVVQYDGSPFYPTNSAMFDLVDETKINVWQTGAKFIDAVKKEGLKPRVTHDLSSLKALHSTGSVLAPECYDYVYEEIKSDFRLSSVTGGTDICGCFAMGSSNLPVYRGESACIALGMKVEVYNDNGYPVTQEKGELVCTATFPSMPVAFWGDVNDEKYHSAYFEKFPGVWCHGDFAEISAQGGLIIYGRSDTVLNPGGVRIGTAEIYRQVEQMEEITDSCVIGQEWDDDTRVVLFVILKDGLELDEQLEASIKLQIRQNATPRHVPAVVVQVQDIPRTTTGKIVEVAVRNVIHGVEVKNRDSLANPGSLALFENIEQLQA
ncbi:acetoacetate--CoA ligase [Pseudomaricurvus alkylphenolicus]|uniref:acetoacetate--CoA ligase n=1 Tax=Pseudomaricurvus alkylphenolicus TaxID=1306991 RepID=UPI0014222CCA|nr:acetoacetate--CoA ligase [Pseudomaricurvus alkylphenolicus]NIB40841.1 acetoacetate--CoA ligase [Pseudomaricurvus alkylphenolicus]